MPGKVSVSPFEVLSYLPSIHVTVQLLVLQELPLLESTLCYAHM